MSITMQDLQVQHSLHVAQHHQLTFMHAPQCLTCCSYLSSKTRLSSRIGPGSPRVGWPLLSSHFLNSVTVLREDRHPWGMYASCERHAKPPGMLFAIISAALQGVPCTQLLEGASSH